MSSSAEIYELLFLGEKVDIPLPDIAAYHVLRVSLYRHHRQMMQIDNSGLQVCQNWDSKEKKGTFWLGKRDKKQVQYQVLIHTKPSDDSAEDSPCPKDN